MPEMVGGLIGAAVRLSRAARQRYTDVVMHLQRCGHVGFFLHDATRSSRLQEERAVDKPDSTMAERIARAAAIFEHQRTGVVPKLVTVVQGDGTLVVTLHGALSPAEQTLSETPDGAAKVREFHRELFASASETMRQEIHRITGVEVREATAEIEPDTGTVVAVFTTGTIVQVYLMKHGIASEVWNAGSGGSRKADEPG